MHSRLKLEPTWRPNPIAKPKRKFTPRRVQTRINERIRAPRVRVLYGDDNKQLGIMATREALEKAKSVGLDLVEIASNADPPVCKITDYGKYCYAQSKLKKNQPKTQARMKEVKFRVRIETNDYNVKLAKAENFLDHGHKLRVQLQFRGREMAHQELGFQLMKRVQEDLSSMAHVDVAPRQAGRNITMMLSPLPESQRVRKFKLPHEFTAEELAREEADHQDFDDDHDDHDDHADVGDVDATANASEEEMKAS